MDETIAELRRQLEEEKQARKNAERREEEARQAREEAERHQAAAEQHQAEAEQRLQPNSLFHLLDRCHTSLSQAIRVETNATLTTQGDATNPVNRLYPKLLVPWLKFPELQERVWEKINSAAAFTSRPLFPSDTQIDYVKSVQNKPIYSDASLRNFERDTVDNFVENVLDALRDDTTLRHEFDIQGRISFYDRATPEETSLENSLEQMSLQNASALQRLAKPARGRGGERGGRTAQIQKAGTGRRRNRRADQFCVHTVADERQTPVYAVEFKAPHKVTISELVAGLHEMDLARDVINQEGDTFEFYATRLVAAVVTQIFSYMIDSGVQYGYICTGEAFVFLHIPKDPTVVQYFLCIPNQDVHTDDDWRLHRTAIGQVLAFTLQALTAEAPSHEWHDVAYNELLTWEVEYLDVLRNIPETIRKDPPTSIYRPSHWKREPKTHNTRSHARCQSCTSTPKHSSTDGSDNDEESHSPSAAAATRSRSSRGRGRGNNRQSTKGRDRKRTGKDKEQTSRKDKQTVLPFCSIACIRGIVDRASLDKNCPNFKRHGGQRHSIGPQEFTRQLHSQLARDRTHGFEQLHVCGRTGYLLKATLLLHGYTVIIKATTAKKQHMIQTEVDNYRKLRSLQGQQIPVCLGAFTPRVSYWYHGELMAQMMILSWSGERLQRIINDGNSNFFQQERDKALSVLRLHGAVHNDSEWRNMLWDDLSGRMAVIDLEDVTWLKRPRPLHSTSGNARRDPRVVAQKSRHSLNRTLSAKTTSPRDPFFSSHLSP